MNDSPITMRIAARFPAFLVVWDLMYKVLLLASLLILGFFNSFSSVEEVMDTSLITFLSLHYKKFPVDLFLRILPIYFYYKPLKDYHCPQGLDKTS